MRHSTLYLLSTILLVSSLSGQDWNRSHARSDLEAFVFQTFPSAATVAPGAVYRAARAKGWLGDAASRALLKRQLKAIARDRGRPGRRIDLRTRTVTPVPQNRPHVAVSEIEYNDSEAYANDLGQLVGPLTATGTISGSADTDCFRFTLPLAGVVTFAGTYSGTTPYLSVTNAQGDENWGYHYYDGPTVVVPLPAGTYHMRLGGVSQTVAYTVALSLQVKALPTLAFGTTTTISPSPDPVAVKVVVPQDGRVRISLNNPTIVDSFLLLQNENWGYIYDVDDASTSTTGQGGLDAQLPKGTYYVYVWADQPSTISLTSSFTAAATPVLNTSANGVLNGTQEGFDLFRVVTTKTEELGLTMTGLGINASTDPYLILYDRNMGQILECDDRDLDSNAEVRLVLPAGVYYVASSSYWDDGGYLLTRTAAAGQIRTSRAGTNPSATVVDETATYRFTLETASRVEFDVAEVGGYDAQVSVLDAKTGLAMSWEDDENLSSGDSTLGMQLPAGEYFVYVREYFGGVGGFDLRVLPPLQRWTGDNVMVLGHAGNPLYFVLSTKTAPASNPLWWVITGNLLVDLPTSIIIPLVMPGGGRIDFQTSLPPNSGAVLQMVDANPVTARGVYSNVLK